MNAEWVRIWTGAAATCFRIISRLRLLEKLQNSTRISGNPPAQIRIRCLLNTCSEYYSYLKSSGNNTQSDSKLLSGFSWPINGKPTINRNTLDILSCTVQYVAMHHREKNMDCLVTAGEHFSKNRAINRKPPITTIEKLLEAMFSFGSAPRLYN
jgi:hypothetical protein